MPRKSGTTTTKKKGTRRPRHSGNPRLRTQGWYTWGTDTKADGYLRVPAVSSVIRVMGKEALGPWYGKVVAEYVGEQVRRYENTAAEIEACKKDLALVIASSKDPDTDPEVQQRQQMLMGLRTYGMTSARLLAILKDTWALSKMPEQYRDTKADMGSAAHKIGERIALGQTPDLSYLDDRLKPYAVSLAEWLMKYRPKFLMAEATVFSRRHRYAGTLDCIVEYAGETWMWDFKTSKDTYDSHALQLAAYKYADFVPIMLDELPDGFDSTGAVQRPWGWEMPMPQVDRCGIVVVGPTGCQLKEWEIGRPEYKAFLKTKGLWSWLGTKPQAKTVDMERLASQGVLIA